MQLLEPLLLSWLEYLDLLLFSVRLLAMDPILGKYKWIQVRGDCKGSNPHCLNLDLNDRKTMRYFCLWFLISKNELKLKLKRERKKIFEPFWRAWPIQPINRFLKNCQNGTFQPMHEI